MTTNKMTDAGSGVHADDRSVRNQTGAQYVMREFARLVHDRRRMCGARTSLRATARDVWQLYPDGYRSFEAFYETTKRLGRKSGNTR